jgi:HK97 family phage prohead protease
MQLSDIEKVARRAGITEEEARTELFGGDRGRTWVAKINARAEKYRPTEPASHALRGEAPEGAVDAEGDQWVIEGHAAVFDEPTMLYSWLRETVKRGAFKPVLRDAPDVRYLVNHQGVPMARTTNGTLTLEEQPRGLFQRAALDARRSDARDHWYAVDRGEISQQSFAFTIARSELRTCECADNGDWDCDCVWDRDIHEVGSLLDVGGVTYPAYPTTDVQVARDSSEQPDERDASASDEERCDEAAGTDTSPTCSGSDQAAAIRLNLKLFQKEHHHVPGTQAGAGAGRSAAAHDR